MSPARVASLAKDLGVDASRPIGAAAGVVLCLPKGGESRAEVEEEEYSVMVLCLLPVDGFSAAS
eukprot:scaffold5145_cov105-Pinguiococcus_pyrenoidosus.AAC.1